MTTLAIKNMVCRRCIRAVEEVLAAMGINPLAVTLGEAVIPRPLTEDEHAQLAARLEALGFELLDDRRRTLIEHAKAAIIEVLWSGDEQLLERIVFSDYLEQKVGVRYSTLSRLFSQLEGKTIERYIIEQKIERVKELIAYGQLSLTEIAYRLGYSSVHYLSSQFKQVTGMTASQFRSLRKKPRRPLDEI
ncbi:MAG: AraC family transcriptional regulator [Chlorobi bacterium NICIL-2]|nr:MAG: AraC family transcriptional regulator [Chlorobi bacterium NICIL-2]